MISFRGRFAGEGKRWGCVFAYRPSIPHARWSLAGGREKLCVSLFTVSGLLERAVALFQTGGHQRIRSRENSIWALTASKDESRISTRSFAASPLARDLTAKASAFLAAVHAASIPRAIGLPSSRIERERGHVQFRVADVSQAPTPMAYAGDG